MARKLYHVHHSMYNTRLKPLLGQETEIALIPQSSQDKTEVYRALKTNATIAYDGRGIISICAGTERTIKRTKSILEKLTDGVVTLAEIKNGGHKGN